MHGLIPEEAFVGLYGQPESGKSFVALDWAMCISEGQDWLGSYPTKQSPVVYIAAEGGRGIQKRVRAWMSHYGKSDLPAMYFLLNPLYVREEGVVEEFLDTLDTQDVWPGLMVLDTLSRSFGGGEENASEDMGHFVQEMTRLAQGRRMACLVVHHTNAAGARERGHTAFRAATDAMFACSTERDSGGLITRVTISNDKQKDDVRCEPIYLRPIQTAVGSLIFERTGPPPAKERQQRQPSCMRKADMVKVLEASENGYTFSEWRLASGVPKPTFSRRVRQLLENSEIFKEEHRYYAYAATKDLAALESGDDE